MLKVGVVGVGHLGQYHAQKYAILPDATLVGVADLNFARAREVAARCRTAAFARPQDLLGRVEAVSIAVPTREHHGVAGAFLERGVHVLLEKPIACTLEEADRLIDLARRRSAVLQIGHLERFNPAVRAALPFLDRPLFIEGTRINPFTERGTDVDVVLDLMIHDLDLTLRLVSQPPVRVEAVGVPVMTNLVDIANARLEFASGCVANLTASRVSGRSERKMRVFQADSYLSIDCGRRTLTRVRRVVREGFPRPEMIVETPEVPAEDALEAEVRAFVQAVQTGGRPAVTGEEGRLALAVALSVLKEIEARFDRRPDILGPRC